MSWPATWLRSRRVPQRISYSTRKTSLSIRCAVSARNRTVRALGTRFGRVSTIFEKGLGKTSEDFLRWIGALDPKDKVKVVSRHADKPRSLPGQVDAAKLRE